MPSLRRWIPIGLNLLALTAAVLLAPREELLGATLGLVLLHGAWVWTGLIAYFLSALSGGLYLALKQEPIFHWSRAMGYTGLFFWLTYLPMSLVVMQQSWGGLFFDEPRWRIPMTFAVVAVLLQAGLALIKRPVWTAAGNLGFGLALHISVLSTRSILHPDSPVFSGGLTWISIYFILLLLLSQALCFQIALLFGAVQPRKVLDDEFRNA